MDLKDQINLENLPHHVAIIMDGNGRWARLRGKDRIFGHEHGVEAIRDTVKAAVELDIKYLTFFAFSTENWERPQYEVNSLMELLVTAIRNETPELNKNGVRLQAIGDLEALPPQCNQELKEAIALTAHNSKLTVIVALSYSSRWEILKTTKKIAAKICFGDLKVDEIDQLVFESNLETAGVPDPDLLIRTSGELRISNFLLWQIAYAELHFPSVLWPDFRKKHFFEAIIEYQKRERRFGRVPQRGLNPMSQK